MSHTIFIHDRCHLFLLFNLLQVSRYKSQKALLQNIFFCTSKYLFHYHFAVGYLYKSDYTLLRLSAMLALKLIIVNIGRFMD